MLGYSILCLSKVILTINAIRPRYKDERHYNYVSIYYNIITTKNNYKYN